MSPSARVPGSPVIDPATFYEQAFRRCDEAMAVTRMSDGLVVDTNDAFARLLGLDPARVVGRRTVDLAGWDPPGRRLELLRELRRSGSVQDFEVVMRPHGRTRRTLLLSAQVVRTSRDPLLFAIGRDVTDIRATEAKLVQTIDVLQRTDAERRTLLTRLVEVQEKERRRIAVELHDGPIQDLASVGLRLEMLGRSLEGGHREKIEEAGKAISLTLQRMRRLMSEWVKGEEADVVEVAAEFFSGEAAPTEMARPGLQNADDSLRSLNTRLENEVASRSQQILDANARLRQGDMQRRRLLRKLSGAQEEERKLLANALHDDIVQILAAAKLRLDMLGDRQSDPEVGADLRAVSDQLVDAIKRCRHLLFVLRPPALDRGGLRVAVDELVQRATAESGIRSSLEYGCEAEPGEHVSTVVFRVLDEAIRNVQKHSKAAALTIEISDLTHGIDVVCRDDGEGFDPGATGQPGHLGLNSMRERVEIVGGTWKLTSASGLGTEIHFWVPLGFSD